ncbi:FKBP-type peptidyl-prolyl cis-trans isomerase [Streptomyces sp. PR69]|uniref:FKBP-type peptidyl-prolyl cis-trans isomerase n=1 Tax=Streptomyces sp. PR69 TaxID=2984950 RepID=UPI0022656080|nr:FKBP-type peptidyl-prolyl cis-trans isomerase [Streptomyces sp. PR69]
MRRLAGLIVVPLLLLTAACGNDTGSDSAPSKNGLPAITAGAKFGEKPTLAKGEGDPPKELKADVISEGDGAKVKDGDYIEVNYLGQAWDSDEPFDNSFDRGEPFGLTLGAGQVIKGWDEGLKGQKVGSRVEIGIPPELGYGEQGQGDIKPNATLVFVVDVLKSTSVPKAAEGAEAAQDDAALPKVGVNADGKAPKITIPKTDPPKKLVSNYILESDGAEVTAKDTVIVAYEAYLWKDAKKFDSTYAVGRNQTLPPLEQISLKGLKDGLTGKKIGSRVLLVIPPDQAFGEQEQQGVPKNSTLVFSVDILAKA